MVRGEDYPQADVSTATCPIMVMAPRSHPCLPEGGPWRSFLAWLVTWEQGEAAECLLVGAGLRGAANSLTHSLSKLIVDAIVDIESLRCDAVLATGLVDSAHRHWHLCVKVWFWCCKLTLVGCHSSIPPSGTHTHSPACSSQRPRTLQVGPCLPAPARRASAKPRRRA